jgi:hypothetical protein
MFGFPPIGLQQPEFCQQVVDTKLGCNLICKSTHTQVKLIKQSECILQAACALCKSDCCIPTIINEIICEGNPALIIFCLCVCVCAVKLNLLVNEVRFYTLLTVICSLRGSSVKLSKGLREDRILINCLCQWNENILSGMFECHIPV